MKCIYVIENEKNGKKYCGSAVNFDKRMKQHFTMLGRGTHFNKHMQSDYVRDRDYFVMYIIQDVPKGYSTDRLRDIEQMYINTGNYTYNKAKYTSKQNSEGRIVNILRRHKQRNYMRRFKFHLKDAANKLEAQRVKREERPQHRRKNKITGEWEYILSPKI